MKIGETLRVVDKKLQAKNYLLGKSFLIAVYCCIRATLYPNSRIIVASGTKNQAKLIISQKIDKELRLKYPNIAREIKEIKAGTNECVVYFYNGSTIEAVTSTDNARGYRCNILILDEFRMISKEMLNKVLRPFLNVVRQPKFFQNPKYKDYPKEENKEIYLSSAWYVSHYAYEKFVAFRNAMCKGSSYFCCDFPYGLALEHGLLTKERVQAMREEEDMDSISWSMEMEGLFFGENESAFFKTGEINPTRTIIKPFYPPTDFEYLSNKDKVKKSNKQQGEIRLIGYDVALMSGSDNDNSIYTLMRLLPNGDEYSRQVVYIENSNGSHSKIQAIRLKQLFYDFEADYIAMDTNGK